VYAQTSRIQFGPGEASPHTVDFLDICVVTAGFGHHLSARGSLPLEPGSVIALRPGAWHGVTECDMEVAILGIPVETLAADLAFLRSRPVIRDLLYSSAQVVGGVRLLSIDPEAALEFAGEVRQLRRYLDERPHDLVLILGQVIVTIGILAGALVGSHSEAPLHPAVEATLERLEAEPERGWRMPELARAANVDPTYLTRLFSTEIGTPPIAHLARIRAERAATLLAESRLSIAQIGAAVGWPDTAHFTRRFRDLVGVTPGHYRNAIRGGSA
jgi:AraC family L-rhamnose operon transcriptional activator RhaR